MLTEPVPTKPRVFLSYARVDRARVARMAAALTAAGHALWWDTAIEAGSAFAQDIARELDAADVVVVAWSAASVKSAWVLDEAGAGRDRNRLVPVLLDGTSPPLGFRQLHAIDLSNGRERKPAGAAELVRAVERVAAAQPLEPTVRAARKSRQLLPWVVALAVLALVGLLGWQQYGSRLAPRDAKPVVAVLPFLDMSAAKGEAYFAEGLAEEILDTLARDTRLKVLGRTTAWAMRDKAGDPAYLRDKFGVTRLLEGSVRGGGAGAGGRVKVSVRLIDTKDGAEIWSQVFDRSEANVLAVQEEVATAVAAQLAGSASDAARPRSTTASVPPRVYEDMVVARQLIRTRQADALQRARVLADKAVAAAPDYAPAYAVRATSLVLLTLYDDLPLQPALDDARRDAERAIALDPRLSEAHAALGNVLISLNDPAGAIAALTRAVKLRPGNAEARMLLGRVLLDNGQINNAITELIAAVAADPLWISPTVNLIRAYGQANQSAKAWDVERRFRALSPDPADAEVVESDAAMATGEFARALRLADTALRRNPKSSNAIASRNNALLPMLATAQIPLTQRIYWPDAYWQALSGRWDETARLLLREGRSVWDDTLKIYLLAYALTQQDRSDALVASFDARFASIAEYSASPAAAPSGAVLIAAAMQKAGRVADATALRGFARARMLRNEAGGLSPSWNSADWAALLVAANDNPGAIAKLEDGLKRNWADVCSGPFWLGDQLPLQALHNEPAFVSVLGRCRDAINKQRALAGLPAAALK